MRPTLALSTVTKRLRLLPLTVPKGAVRRAPLTTPSGSLNSVQEGSYTISGWFKRSSASAGYPNAFLARGYNGGQSDGVLNNINTMITRAYDGQRIWTTEDLFIDGDGQFRNAGVGITQNDNFMFLAMSTFVVPETGAYRFKMEWKDDRAVGWMDLNKNNTFDLASEKLGGNNNWESAVLNLTAGDKHLFATAMAEWGGGSRHRSLIKTPSITSYALIDPSSRPRRNVDHRPGRSLGSVISNMDLLSKGNFGFAMDGAYKPVFNHSGSCGLDVP